MVLQQRKRHHSLHFKKKTGGVPDLPGSAISIRSTESRTSGDEDAQPVKDLLLSFQPPSRGKDLSSGCFVGVGWGGGVNVI